VWVDQQSAMISHRAGTKDSPLGSSVGVSNSNSYSRDTPGHEITFRAAKLV
jgi:hypothetical protein